MIKERLENIFKGKFLRTDIWRIKQPRGRQIYSFGTWIKSRPDVRFSKEHDKEVDTEADLDSLSKKTKAKWPS